MSSSALGLFLLVFATAGGESIYFRLANPRAANFADDEWIGARP